MALTQSKDRLSIAALVLANLAPLGGVIFGGWDAGALVFLYWMENVVVGFYNVLKIAVAIAGSPAPLLVLLVAGKIALDLYLHARSHRTAGGQERDRGRSAGVRFSGNGSSRRRSCAGR